MYQAIMPFHPQFASQAIAVTASSVATQIAPATTSGYGAIRIANSGTNSIFFTLGSDNTVTTSATTGICMLPNTVETFYVRQDQRFIALLSTATGNTAYVSFGESA